MSWLRTRRRTLDLNSDKTSVTSQYEIDETIPSMDNGSYTCQNTFTDLELCEERTSILPAVEDSLLFLNKQTLEGNNNKALLINVLECPHNGCVCRVTCKQDTQLDNDEIFKCEIEENCKKLEEQNLSPRKRAVTWSSSVKKKPMSSLNENEAVKESVSDQDISIYQRPVEFLEDLPIDHLRDQKQRKSISWAEDLETVHEFERIKGRKLSLAALFKKI